MSDDQPMKTAPRLSDQQVQQLNAAVDQMSSSEDLFLNPTLTLGEMAAHVGVSNNDLSWWLNNVQHMSFYEYVNHKRMQPLSSASKSVSTRPSP